MFILLAATELLLERKMQERKVSLTWILDLFPEGLILFFLKKKESFF